ncbi:ABC transporter ATP-binding protein [Bermanella sp. 47_1433_sub80_T6]|mgnify:FL=1|nr:ABC transporter ATP-binding protein [Bermanella sp. 47_1433_sub80_T6]
MQHPLLQIHQLTRHFKMGDRFVAVLNNSHLHVQKGETIALLGRSGCGKSTLLNLLAGIDLPDSGHVFINNENLGQMNEKTRTQFRRRHIGFVHQFFNLIPTLTAAENIALPLELNQQSNSEIKIRVKKMLKEIQLEERADDYPEQLSGGEQQRIALARALIHQPMLVLADEPTGNLDAQTGKQILNLLHTLVKQMNCTLVMVTHSLAVARNANRILTLDSGKISEQPGDFAW